MALEHGHITASSLLKNPLCFPPPAWATRRLKHQYQRAFAFLFPSALSPLLHPANPLLSDLGFPACTGGPSTSNTTSLALQNFLHHFEYGQDTNGRAPTALRPITPFLIVRPCGFDSFLLPSLDTFFLYHNHSLPFGSPVHSV